MEFLIVFVLRRFAQGFKYIFFQGNVLNWTDLNFPACKSRFLKKTTKNKNKSETQHVVKKVDRPLEKNYS